MAESRSAGDRPVEVRTERDLNLLTNEPVLRIFARYVGTRKWSKFVALTSKSETLEYLEANAQRLGETWLRLGPLR